MFSNLLPPKYKEEIKKWIDDDCPSIDIGGYVVGNKIETASLYCKSTSFLAGIPFANAVFEYLNISVEWFYEEGSYIEINEGKVVVAKLKGQCRNILLAERTALNILSRASGVALGAHKAANLAKENNWHGFIAGTRKTTPGFKFVEKYALIVGGVATHRQDLSQMVMLKDNHIWSTGSITAAVQKAKSAAGFSSKIEVECGSIDEALEACAAGADIVMLDNFSAEKSANDGKVIKSSYPNVLIEASGGITYENMKDFMIPEIDIISRGSLTQGNKITNMTTKSL
mmetsp:Transcript_7965/g.7120  ORF Transcript_7965/g.7120 Transcript_7965/m.7120 type:complete len:285 (-) Transcript_7965:13-867(-)